MNVLVLGGFLGSGKTTALLSLAKYIISREGSEGTTVMIIENEIGEVGVDDKLLKSEGFAVKDLFAGCACCTSGGDLLNDLAGIQKEINPRWVIIEATGVAYPRQIKDSVTQCFNLPVKVMALADASRWKRLRRAMSGLLDAQLDCADLILLNKTDLVSEEDADEIFNEIRGINSIAAIYKTSAPQGINEEIWTHIV